MDLIDEHGRIFGIVNVVDALVVVLVAAVVVAGLALVLQDPESDGPAPEPERELRYATVTFGENPPPVANAIDTGDRLRLAAGTRGNSTVRAGNATVRAGNVTDVYRVPGRKDTVFVVARIALTGQVQEGTFVVSGTPIRVGNALTVVGDDAALEGRITAVNASGEHLPTGRTALVLESTVSTAVAGTLGEGDTYRVGSATGGVVESLTVYPTGNPDKRLVQLGVRLRTLSTGAGPEYAGRPIRVGEKRTLAPDNATVRGTVLAMGAVTPPGERTDVRVNVVWHDVESSIVGTVSVNATEQLRAAPTRTPTAVVVDRQVSPEQVVVKADDGTIHRRDHPLLWTVRLAVDMAVRRTDEGLVFHGRRLAVGRNVVLDFGEITVKGRVVAIRHGSEAIRGGIDP